MSSGSGAGPLYLGPGERQDEARTEGSTGTAVVVIIETWEAGTAGTETATQETETDRTGTGDSTGQW